jgi:hypothetical protein
VAGGVTGSVHALSNINSTTRKDCLIGIDFIKEAPTHKTL